MLYNVREIKEKPVFMGTHKTKEDKIMDVIACQKGIGWSHVQLDEITKMRKAWNWEAKEYRVDVFFGRLRDGRSTPVVIMNVYEQGAGAKQVIDNNCDVWQNMFTRTTEADGNEFFRYLRKHGFAVVR